MTSQPTQSDPAQDDSSGREKDWRRRLMVFFLAVALLDRLVFWGMTDRVWEDALITIRHAENAARGVGLTHHPAHGDPVHGFTSPISVLIPLIGELLHAGIGLTVLRVSSLIAAAWTVVLGYQIAIHPRVDLSIPATGFFLGFLAVEFHQILFGMAGMETQWIVAITLLTILQFLKGNTIRLGLACGLCMWGRPDGVVTVLAVLTALAWQQRFRSIPVVIALCVVSYAPWFAFTELYYGSVVPHTIVAKKVAYVRSYSEELGWWAFLSRWAAELVRRADFLRLWFSPLYGGTGSVLNFIRGARPLQLVYFLVACVGCLRCVRQRDCSLISIFVVGFAAYMLLFLAQPAWWYILPWLNVVGLLFAIGIDRIRTALPDPRWRIAWGLVPVVYVSLYAFALTRTFPAERNIQLGIEDACREPIGRWLESNVEPQHWVCCECLGYLGSYSNRPILDFPGLCCPRSVRANLRLPEGQRSLVALAALEKPEWLVLRPSEYESLRQSSPETADRYIETKRFYADPQHVREMGQWIWADGFEMTIDEEFIVLRREDVPWDPKGVIR